MKKPIAFTSIGLCLGLALVLANAEEQTSNTSESSISVPQRESSQPTGQQQASRGNETCVNANGVIFSPTDPGFQKCSERSGRETGSQLGGQRGEEKTSEPKSKMDTERAHETVNEGESTEG